MIDPPKATKGRRMSKITRKKSSKSGSLEAAGKSSGKSAKRPPAKAAAKSSGNSKTLARTKTAGKNKAVSKTTAVSKKLTKKSGLKASKPTAKAGPKAPVSAKASAAKPPAGVKPSAGAAMAAKRKPSGAPAAVTKTAPAGLSEGSPAPDFNLPRDGGSHVSLSSFSGQNLVLFFYPRADTPGCTREAIDFTRLAAQFTEAQTAVLGISADPPKAQEAFRDKHQLAIPLASDESQEMLEAYGVWGEKSMYGRTFKGILRTTVLIGGDRRVIRIWRNVKVDGHAEEVLAAVRAL
jgi:peroxiredoxin Q/BCP